MFRYRIATLAALLLTSPAMAQNTDSFSGATSAAQAIIMQGGGSSGGTQRLSTVPSVLPPSIQGANPCNIGVSGGGSVLGFGASAAVLAESRRCRGQEWFRFQMMAGNPAAARAIACVTDEDMREAYRLVGQPCPQDGPPAASQAAPLSQPRLAAAAPQAAPPAPARAMPDWCLTASAAERQARAECR